MLLNIAIPYANFLHTDAGDLLAEALTNLFNMCISHGYVPNNFFESIIVPVIKDKNGKSDVYDNCRPITLVTMFSKILNVVVEPKLYLYCMRMIYNLVLCKERDVRKYCLSWIQWLIIILVLAVLFLWPSWMPPKRLIESIIMLFFINFYLLVYLLLC